MHIVVIKVSSLVTSIPRLGPIVSITVESKNQWSAIEEACIIPGRLNILGCRHISPMLHCTSMFTVVTWLS